MVRDNSISATKPIFPGFLLPNIRIPFTNRRRSSASSTDIMSHPSDDDERRNSTAQTTPNNSPPTQHSSYVKPARTLTRLRQDTLRCKACSADLAFVSQIVSKGFMGRYGRAFLVQPLPESKEKELMNLWIGRNEHRQLATGWHVVADISCGQCSEKLGWKYVDAKEPSQKYKVDKYILESERVVTYYTWEDMEDIDVFEEVGSTQKDKEVNERRRTKARKDKCPNEEEESDEDGTGEQEVEDIEFDSSDDDECEDIFAGVWEAEATRKRRQSLMPERKRSRSEA